MLGRVAFCCIVAIAVLGCHAAFAASTTNPAKPGPTKPALLTIDLGGDAVMKLVKLPAGDFLMGSAAAEAGHDADETQHQVKITRAFYLQTTPVTQAQWKALMDSNPSQFTGDDLPVENITWLEAMDFCRRLSDLEGKEYRLPTEAEWEYACRAGTSSAYSAGDKEADLAMAGWYVANSEGKTHPVAQKKSNVWGLYDMHGDVWQWCGGWYGAYPASEVSDPVGPENGVSRVQRGGSWNSRPTSCRCASRRGGSPANHDGGMGFRVAMTAPTTRPFNSQIKFNVNILQSPQAVAGLGQTPYAQPLTVSEAVYWYVMPREHIDSSALVHEMNDKQIPGIQLFSATADDLAQLAQVKDLQVLRLDGYTGTEQGLAVLKEFKNLRALSISGPLGDAAMEAMGHLSSLRWLQLGGATDARLRYLKDLKGLSQLFVGDSGVTDAGIEELRGLANLQVLGIRGTQITDEALKYVKEMKQLRSLDVTYTSVGDKGLEYLKQATNLQSLNLTNTKVTDAGLAQLKELKHLQDLRLWSTGVTDAGTLYLKEMTSLRKLSLRATQVTPAGLANLASLHLQELDIERPGEKNMILPLHVRPPRNDPP